MSETKHTQGPWKAVRAESPDNTGGFDWAILDANSRIVSEAFEHVGQLSGGYDKRPAEANARLIAAAPDLLEALQEILGYRGGADNALDDEYVMERARAAIAKAEREQS